MEMLKISKIMLICFFIAGQLYNSAYGALNPVVGKLEAFISNASNKTPYQILGVSPSATDREISTAYRNLSREYHPGKSQIANDKIAEALATRAFQIINNANEQIKKMRSQPHGAPVDQKIVLFDLNYYDPRSEKFLPIDYNPNNSWQKLLENIAIKLNVSSAHKVLVAMYKAPINNQHYLPLNLQETFANTFINKKYWDDFVAGVSLMQNFVLKFDFGPKLGRTFSIDKPLNTPISEIRKLIAQTENIPDKSFQLIFDNEELNDMKEDKEGNKKPLLLIDIVHGSVTDNVITVRDATKMQQASQPFLGVDRKNQAEGKEASQKKEVSYLSESSGKVTPLVVDFSKPGKEIIERIWAQTREWGNLLYGFYNDVYGKKYHFEIPLEKAISEDLRQKIEGLYLKQKLYLASFANDPYYSRYVVDSFDAHLNMPISTLRSTVAKDFSLAPDSFVLMLEGEELHDTDADGKSIMILNIIKNLKKESRADSFDVYPIMIFKKNKVDFDAAMRAINDPKAFFEEEAQKCEKEREERVRAGQEKNLKAQKEKAAYEAKLKAEADLQAKLKAQQEAEKEEELRREQERKRKEQEAKAAFEAKLKADEARQAQLRAQQEAEKKRKKDEAEKIWDAQKKADEERMAQEHASWQKEQANQRLLKLKQQQLEARNKRLSELRKQIATLSAQSKGIQRDIDRRNDILTKLLVEGKQDSPGYRELIQIVEVLILQRKEMEDKIRAIERQIRSIDHDDVESWDE